MKERLRWPQVHKDPSRKFLALRRGKLVRFEEPRSINSINYFIQSIKADRNNRVPTSFYSLQLQPRSAKLLGLTTSLGENNEGSQGNNTPDAKVVLLL